MPRTVSHSLCKAPRVHEKEKSHLSRYWCYRVLQYNTHFDSISRDVRHWKDSLYSMFQFPCCVEVHLRTQKQMDPATCNCIAFRQLDNDIRRATNDTADTDDTLHWAATVASRIFLSPPLYLCSKHSSSLTRCIETDVWPFLPWLLCPSDAFDPPRNLVTM